SAPVLQFLCHHRLHCRGDLCGQPARSAVVSQFDPHHTAPAPRLRQLCPQLPHGAHLLVLRARGPRHGGHVQALRGAEEAPAHAARRSPPVRTRCDCAPAPRAMAPMSKLCGVRTQRAKTPRYFSCPCSSIAKTDPPRSSRTTTCRSTSSPSVPRIREVASRWNV